MMKKKKGRFQEKEKDCWRKKGKETTAFSTTRTTTATMVSVPGILLVVVLAAHAGALNNGLGLRPQMGLVSFSSKKKKAKISGETTKHTQVEGAQQ